MWLFAQASLPAGSHWLGQGGLSWALRAVQREALALHNHNGSDPGSLTDPCPILPALAPERVPAQGTVPARPSDPRVGDCVPRGGSGQGLASSAPQGLRLLQPFFFFF